MRQMLWVALVSCAVSACARNYVKSDTAALGRVVVYRNGVAYYERRAHLQDNRLVLSVPKTMVDDFLKSLTVKDAYTGDPLPVSFPSQPRHSGNHVEMVIRVPDGAPREVVLTYITEAPAWKPSYRIVVGKDGNVQLQGWAVVDNTSGEDWRNVLVGVGSSSALSFRYDLWSVRSVHRHTLVDEQRFAVAPPRGQSPHRENQTGAVLAELDDDALEATRDEPVVAEVIQTTGSAPRHGEITASSGVLRSREAPAKLSKEQRYKHDKRRKDALERQQRRKKNADRIIKLAESLKRRNVKVTIEGHAGIDETNPDAKALERANALRNKLIKHGVPPANLDVRSGGAVAGRPSGIRLVSETEATPPAAHTQQPIGESHFQSQAPMSVGSGQSVMVSILNGATKGQVVYLYDAESSHGNQRFAFKAVRLQNPTSSTLETGPVTVYGQQGFIGEGLTEPVPPNATAMVPFALDRQVVVESQQKSRDHIRRMVALERGILTTEVQHHRRTEYKVTNRLSAAARVYLRHTVASGWKLVDAPDERERLGQAHLFAVDLKPQQTQTVVVVEATPLTRTVDLRDPEGLDMVRVHLSNSSGSATLAAKVTELLDLQRAIAEHRQTLENLHRRQDEYRVRMDELHGQIVSLKAVKSGGTLVRHLQAKMRQVSERVQKLTIRAVEREEKILLARVRFQDQVAELALPQPQQPQASR